MNKEILKNMLENDKIKQFRSAISESLTEKALDTVESLKSKSINENFETANQRKMFMQGMNRNEHELPDEYETDDSWSIDDMTEEELEELLDSIEDEDEDLYEAAMSPEERRGMMAARDIIANDMPRKEAIKKNNTTEYWLQKALKTFGKSQGYNVNSSKPEAKSSDSSGDNKKDAKAAAMAVVDGMDFGKAVKKFDADPALVKKLLKSLTEGYEHPLD